MLLRGDGGSGQGRGSWLNHKPEKIRGQEKCWCQYRGSRVLPCPCPRMLEEAARAAASRFLPPARAKPQHKTFPGVPSAPLHQPGHTASLPRCVATHHLPGPGRAPGGCSTLGRSAGPSWVPAADPAEGALRPGTKPPGHLFGLPAAPTAEPPWPGALPQAADSSWGQGPAAQTRAGERPVSLV